MSGTGGLEPGSPGMQARFRGQLGRFDLDIAFQAPGQGLTAVFGPSGCGKTTLLRAVAGLQRFQDGLFILGRDAWQDETRFVPVHKRPIGYVFQEASLFPHLSVKGNLRYGLRRALKAGAAETIRFDEIVELLGISHLLGRDPRTLSGGERQRVAMGRALLSQPRLLLMDEPLAALDRLAKDEILPYLERIRDVLTVPMLYVSHDIAEVERLADHIVLMQAGRLAAAGPMREVQADPRLPLARLPEAGVTLAAVVTEHDPAYGLTALSVAGGRLLVPGALGVSGQSHRLRIAASDVSLALTAPAASSVLNILPARVLSIEVLDETQVMVVLALGTRDDGARILSRITRRSRDTLGLSPGDIVHAQVKGVALAAGPRQEADAAG